MTITRLSPDFAVAPQLDPDDLAAVAALGFRALVNNRPDGEEPGQPSSETLAAEAARLGLPYRHIPLGQGDDPIAQARKLGELLREIEGPVLAFCRSGTRSAHLWNLSRQLD